MLKPVARLSLCVLCLASPLLAEQEAAPAGPVASMEMQTQSGVSKPVQLGISVSKPSSAVYAQLPKLPRGSGFLLQSVTVGGTADAAGLKPLDVIWKLGDQILINENQLMTLLSHYKPGDKATLSYFHAGEARQVTLVLQGGAAKPASPSAIAITPPVPGVTPTTDDSGLPALPMRVISYEDRSASISDQHGTATLTFREGKPWLQVESAQGVETFNGPVVVADDIARVPVAWRGRLPILKRSLEESSRLRRLPRVRRIPTPKQRIAGGE